MDDALMQQLAALHDRVRDLERIERPRTRHHGRVFRGVFTQSIPNTTVTAISFDSVVEDTSGMWNALTPDQIVCNLAGWYSLGGVARFDPNATGYRNVRIQINGVNTAIIQTPAVSGDGTILSIHTEYKLAVGDVVKFLAQQNSGGALNVSIAGLAPAMWWTRLA